MPGLVERVREERRVRRDFDALMASNGLEVPRGSLRKERRERVRLRDVGLVWWLNRLVVLMLALAVLFAGVVILAPLPYDPPSPLQSAFFVDQAGRPIARVNAEERREFVPFRRVPEVVRQAFLAAEDE